MGSASGRGPKIFFDGGCRPNPGRMEAAVVARGVVLFFDNLGSGSSGEAEWLALLCAVEEAAACATGAVTLLGDSRHAVSRANALLTGSPPANSLEERLLVLAAPARKFRIRWIKREQNLAGIALANRPRP